MTYDHSFSQGTKEENSSPWFAQTKEWPAGISQKTCLYWIPYRRKTCVIYAEDKKECFLNQVGNIKRKIRNNCHLIIEATLTVLSKIITCWPLYHVLLFFLAFVITIYMFLCSCIFYLPSLESKLHERRDLLVLFTAVLPAPNVYNVFYKYFKMCKWMNEQIWTIWINSLKLIYFWCLS